MGPGANFLSSHFGILHTPTMWPRVYYGSNNVAWLLIIGLSEICYSNHTTLQQTLSKHSLSLRHCLLTAVMNNEGDAFVFISIFILISLIHSDAVFPYLGHNMCSVTLYRKKKKTREAEFVDGDIHTKCPLIMLHQLLSLSVAYTLHEALCSILQWMENE